MINKNPCGPVFAFQSPANHLTSFQSEFQSLALAIATYSPTSSPETIFLHSPMTVLYQKSDSYESVPTLLDISIALTTCLLHPTLSANVLIAHQRESAGTLTLSFPASSTVKKITISCLSHSVNGSLLQQLEWTKTAMCILSWEILEHVYQLIAA